MTPTPKRAEPLPPATDEAEPLELTQRRLRVHSGAGRAMASAGGGAAPRIAAPAGARCSESRSACSRSLWLGLLRLVGRTDARRAAAVLAAGRAMARDRRRAARAARPRLADVRPHPAQGSRALHPLGHRDAHRGAVARGAARGSVAADQRQPHRADDDGPASDAARRRDDGQARRHHPASSTAAARS